jgi:hypothetical protein
MMKQVVQLGLLPLLSVMLFGCGEGFSANQPDVPLSSIREVRQQSNPGAMIYLKGQVMQQAPFLQGGAYLLRDETGQIWVVTAGSLPKTGDEAIVKGQPSYQSIPVGGQELGEVYVRELEQVLTGNGKQ